MTWHFTREITEEVDIMREREREAETETVTETQREREREREILNKEK